MKPPWHTEKRACFRIEPPALKPDRSLRRATGIKFGGHAGKGLRAIARAVLRSTPGWRFFLVVLVAIVAGGCASSPKGRSAPGGETNRPSVRRVDFPPTPECGELAESARRLGNEAYPKILALLADEKVRMPRQFNIVITRQLAQNHRRAAMRRARNWTKGVIPVGVTYEVSAATWGRTIQLDADTFVRNPDALDATLVHEMTHVAQHCLLPPSARHWYEGIAAYVPYKLGYTNDSSCPQCSDVFPHYTYG